MLSLLAVPLIAVSAFVFLTLSFVGGANADQSGGQLALAEEHLARGDGIAAEVELRKALNSGALHPAVSALMGEAEIQQGDLAEARRWLESGDFSPEYRARGFQALGRLEMLEGNLPQAGWSFDRSYEVNPDSSSLWVDIAKLRYRGGEHIGALEAIDRALQLAPEDPRGLEFKGSLVRESDGVIQAIPLFEQGLSNAPNDLSLLIELAASLGEAGRARDMLSVVRQIGELDPKNERILIMQSILAARAGENSLARRILWRVEDAYKKQPSFLLLIGLLELEAGNPATAQESLAELLKQQPDNRRARQLYARALLEDGAARDVVSRFGPSALRPDSDPYLMTVVARAHEMLGQREKAAVLLDRAANAERPFVANVTPNANVGSLRSAWEANPRSVILGIAYIRALVAERQIGRAIGVARELERTYPQSADVALIAGDALLAAKQFQPAIAKYRQAAQIREPNSVAVRQAAALIDSGQFSEAEVTLRQHLTDVNANTTIADLLTILAVQKSDWVTAHEWLKYASSLPTSGNDPELLRWYAEMKLRKGDTEAALPIITKSYQLQPLNPETARTFSEILERTRSEGSAPAKLMAAKARLTSQARPTR